MKTLLVLVVSMAMMVAMAANAAIVGEWLFNEGSGGVAKDTSGNGNDGTIDKAAWEKNGKYGAALDFDGRSSSVVVEHADMLAPLDAATVTVWVYPRSRPAAIASVLSKGGVHRDFDLQVEAGELMKWYVSSTPTNYNVASSSSMPFDEWTFVAVTYAAEEAIAIYINGELENTTQMFEERDASTEPIRIGISFWPDRFWDGLLDEIRLFDTVLSEEEIKEVMGMELAVDSAGKLATSWGRIKSE